MRKGGVKIRCDAREAGGDFLYHRRSGGTAGRRDAGEFRNIQQTAEGMQRVSADLRSSLIRLW